jgi:hypothetical protein
MSLETFPMAELAIIIALGAGSIVLIGVVAWRIYKEPNAT